MFLEAVLWYSFVLADLVDLAEKLKSRMLNFSDGLKMDLIKNIMSAISSVYISGSILSCVNLLL